jgi:FkbM family methyltransferase
MIEHNGVLIHLDPKGDRVGNSDLKFEGWVAAHQPIKGVWLAAERYKALALCERPDVKRVLPDRISLGFLGTSKGSDLRPTGLRLGLQVGDDVFEVEHPVPPPLARQPFQERIVIALQLGWLAVGARLAPGSQQRWRFTLRRHLLYRRRRSNVFRRSHTEALLEDFATAVPEAFFVQIGANDGQTGDPIYGLLARGGRRWRGVMVEPVAHLFAQLSERYGGNSAIRLERAAIGETDGTTVIHRLQTKPEDSLWLQQLPSLDLELLLRNARQFGVSEKLIVSETVPSFTVSTLLKRHDISRLDLLVIDTEGWDWRILRQFDLTVLRPKLVLYEHQHLSPEERAQAHQFLARDAYEWAETPEGDTVAWKTSHHSASASKCAHSSQSSS